MSRIHSSFFLFLARSVEAVEYTDGISAKGSDSPNECPVYDTKRSDGEATAILGLWGIRNTRLLPSQPKVVAPNRFLSIGQAELSDSLTVYFDI